MVQRKLDDDNGRLLRTIAGFILEDTCKNFILWLDKNNEKIYMKKQQTD